MRKETPTPSVSRRRRQRKKMDPPDKPLSPSSIVTLCVGGQEFATTVTTLRKVKLLVGESGGKVPSQKLDVEKGMVFLDVVVVVVVRASFDALPAWALRAPQSSLHLVHAREEFFDATSRQRKVEQNASGREGPRLSTGPSVGSF